MYITKVSKSVGYTSSPSKDSGQNPGRKRVIIQYSVADVRFDLVRQDIQYHINVIMEILSQITSTGKVENSYAAEQSLIPEMDHFQLQACAANPL